VRAHHNVVVDKQKKENYISIILTEDLMMVYIFRTYIFWVFVKQKYFSFLQTTGIGKHVWYAFNFAAHFSFAFRQYKLCLVWKDNQTFKQQEMIRKPKARIP